MKNVYRLTVFNSKPGYNLEKHYRSCLYSTLDKAIYEMKSLWMVDYEKLIVLDSSDAGIPATKQNIANGIKHSGVSAQCMIWPSMDDKGVYDGKFFVCSIEKIPVV